MALKSLFNRRHSSASPTSSSSTGFPKPDKQTSWDQNDPPRVGAYQFPTSPANSPSAGDYGVVSVVVTEPPDPPQVSSGTYGAQLHPLSQPQQGYPPDPDGLASERSRHYQPYRPPRGEAYYYHPSALERGEDTSGLVAGQSTQRLPLHHRSLSGQLVEDALAVEGAEVMLSAKPQILKTPPEPVLTHPQITTGSSQGTTSQKSKSSKHSRPGSASRRASPAPDLSSDTSDTSAGDVEIPPSNQLNHSPETPRRHRDTHSQAFTVEVIEDSAQASSLLYIMPPVNVPALQVATPAKEHFDTGLMMLPTSSNTAVDADDEESGSTNTAEPSETTDSDLDQNGNVHQTKPTCSLNLVCYRSGASGCKLHQLHVAKQSRFKDEKAFLSICKARPDLITTDEQFFRALRNGYQKEMCGFFRRIFFLKTLRGLRLLAYTQNSRPTVVPLDGFVLQEILYAFNHPSQIDTEHVWIDWVFQLRQRDKRHALEFIEDWNGTRIAVAGSLPLVVSTVVGLTWSIRSGDWQTAFTVAGFILTAGTLLLALLAVVSGIEASSRATTS